MPFGVTLIALPRRRRNLLESGKRVMEIGI